MSSSYTTPRAGGTKPASTEEISDQIDELRSQLQKLTSTVTSVTGKQIKSTQESLETAIRDNPLAALSIAAGIGFLYAMIQDKPLLECLHAAAHWGRSTSRPSFTSASRPDTAD